MKKLVPQLLFLSIVITTILACGEDRDDIIPTRGDITLQFSHNWNDQPVNAEEMDIMQYKTANGDSLSITRLRYVISRLRFVNEEGEVFEPLQPERFNFVEVDENKGLTFVPNITLPIGKYNLYFTFGLNNEDNALNHVQLNSAIFNVPTNMGGGYHYMQLDGNFKNTSAEILPYNYHMIRAVENIGTDPTFPKDTFFEANVGTFSIVDNATVEVKMNVANWFKNPHLWNLNFMSIKLMRNVDAQYKMHDNGKDVFSIGEVTQ